MIPETQALAWALIRSKLSACQFAAFQTFCNHPGSTRNEADVASGNGQVNVSTSRRIAELLRLGLLREGEARPCRVSGRSGTTYWPVMQEPMRRPKVPGPSKRMKAALVELEGLFTGPGQQQLIDDIRVPKALDIVRRALGERP